MNYRDKKKKSKNKNKSKKNRVADGYDLRENLSRVNQRGDIINSSTSTISKSEEQDRVGITSDTLLNDMNQTSSNYPTSDNVYGEITELRKEIYSTSKELNENTSFLKLDLEKKINALNSTIVDKRDSLRLELERKISDKIDKTYFNILFFGAISLITTIGGTIYYKMEKSYDLSKDNGVNIIQIKKDINSQKGNIEELKKKSHEPRK